MLFNKKWIYVQKRISMLHIKIIRFCFRSFIFDIFQGSLSMMLWFNVHIVYGDLRMHTSLSISEKKKNVKITW